MIISLLIIAGIILLIYVLIKPGNKKKCYEHNWLYKKPIAHRGYHNGNDVIENSKTAFELAIKKGYNIEIDIQLTKDDKIIVYHDDNFERLHNVNKKVRESTLYHIEKLSYEKSDDKIMTLEEFLSFVDKRAGLLIELKSQDKKTDELLCKKTVELLKNYQGKYVIQSFNPKILSYFKKNYPLIPRGQLCGVFNLKYEAKKMKGKGFKKIVSTYLINWCYNNKFTNIIGRPHFLSHDHNKINFMADVCHLLMPMLVYTIRNEIEYDKIYNDVDNIIFENLDLRENGKPRKQTKSN